MTTDLHDHYDPDFFHRLQTDSRVSADHILPLILKALPFDSMIDFGCGVGTWLAAARAAGVKTTKGIDGPWVQRTQLMDPEVELVNCNLEERIAVEERFDLATSLEVAEHLSENRARSFVEDICRTSTRVLFSAAIPGQGGENHINERWQSYWVNLFAACDYRPLDVIRPLIWDRQEISIHYRQNLVLYVHVSEHDTVAGAFRHVYPMRPDTFDLVHPELYERKQAELRDLSFGQRARIALGLPGALVQALRNRIPS